MTKTSEVLCSRQYHPNLPTVSNIRLQIFCIQMFCIQFSDLFYFEFSRKKCRLSFVIAKMDTQLMLDKPAIKAFKIFIQFLFNFINIFMMTYMGFPISIRKKIAFDSLLHIISIYEREEGQEYSLAVHHWACIHVEKMHSPN